MCASRKFLEQLFSRLFRRKSRNIDAGGDILKTCRKVMSGCHGKLKS